MAIALITGVTVTVVMLVTVMAIIVKLEQTFQKRKKPRQTPGEVAQQPPPAGEC